MRISVLIIYNDDEHSLLFSEDEHSLSFTTMMNTQVHLQTDDILFIILVISTITTFSFILI